ncbi:sensor histidine kinase [Dawidia soli]|uniref:histidine kinase n=1 Tax=Dawidia soli TaxID=2782352 RepID=A0AAP2GG44_9BACT|nr:ATP-binding protein [Dawidia soli]MBT1690154.1 tetratricopeptide repeat-containing sensor histidine kinase [Dawidia soli]
MFCFTGAYSQEDINADLTWYDSFPEAGKKAQIERLLREADTRYRQAQHAGDAAGQAKALTETGAIYLSVYQFEAIAYFRQALILEDSLHLYGPKIFTCMALARASEMTGDYRNSIQRLTLALQLSTHFKSEQLLAKIRNELGKAYAASGTSNSKDSLHLLTAAQNYEQVLHRRDELAGSPEVARALFNLGNLYTAKHNYAEALKRHKEALSVWRTLGDRKNEAISLNAIGELYTLQKKDDRTLANHVAALEIRNRLKDKSGIAQSYNNIGAFYYREKQYEKAVANLLPGLDAAQEAQAQHEIAKSYEYLKYCFSELGDYQKALEYGNSQIAISDLIQAERNDRQTAETEMQFRLAEIGTLEDKALEREKEIRRQEERQLYLYAFIALAVVILLLVLYQYMMKQRTNRMLEQTNATIQQQNLALQDLNATKDKFFSIISHDLKGPLNSLTSFSGLLINHTDSLSKDEIRMLAQDLDKSVKNLFALLENLLEWSRSQTGNIEFRPEVFDLATVMEENKALLTAQAQTKKIELAYKSEGTRIVQAHKNSVTTVVRNLLSNAIKFTPEGGSIWLTAESRQGQMQVAIADNGVGMSPEVVQKLFRIDTKHSTKGTANEKGTGLGLILCKDFIEKNGGRIWVESEPGKGSVFVFTLPQPLGGVV